MNPNGNNFNIQILISSSVWCNLTIRGGPKISSFLKYQVSALALPDHRLASYKQSSDHFDVIDYFELIVSNLSFWRLPIQHHGVVEWITILVILSKVNSGMLDTAGKYDRG